MIQKVNLYIIHLEKGILSIIKNKVKGNEILLFPDIEVITENILFMNEQLNTHISAQIYKSIVKRF
jgi:hypothetical protein